MRSINQIRGQVDFDDQSSLAKSDRADLLAYITAAQALPAKWRFDDAGCYCGDCFTCGMEVARWDDAQDLELTLRGTT